MASIATVVVLILILVTTALLMSRRALRTADFPYRKCTALFTPAERSFLGVLDQAAGPSYRVFGKVRLADVIEVHGVSNRSKHSSAFNKISSKHVDFVLCRADDLSVVGAIELDDGSHQRKASRQRDQFVERACQVAGIPLLRFPAKQAYTVSQVRSQILEAL
ncbi:DUF2726 domain-containing protein [Aquisalimonas sp. 2447]|uniref:DUF2726 domain-containing protein n=1 Tax=Aquisalimonas sp. 2447 TaxID=2740807 RepID=UPI0014325533|nr:DUF2726 domain-containing protein [Aquisalimonas sp. 2447]QIT54490.1 DUF2726 domain-containing protein [Aquisalimonas sp. 2447]